ncbi:IS1 family transposase [Thermodesulfovibrio sp.]|uniref:IS1/IS1595 family N-terminal zinc-binding domain-containing protein n=1 Tax=Thermodesulfovibrio sp. TaxID=2067987 RepID=UPI0030B44B82
MKVLNDISVRCPRCNSEAIYKYGRIKSGKQRYLCLVCKKQFTTFREQKEDKRPLCRICGSKMYVYMKCNGGVVIYRCSRYPLCKEYKKWRVT